MRSDPRINEIAMKKLRITNYELRIVKWDGTLVILGVAVGLIIGLAIGWIFWPVEWTGVVLDQKVYVHNVADLFAFDGNQERVQSAMGYWDGAAVTCQMLRETTDTGLQSRLWMVLFVMGKTCQ